MKLFLVTFLVSFGLYGCATANYHYFRQAGESTDWVGPIYSSATPEENAYAACNAVAFSGPHAIRIHNEDTGQERTYICSEYPKYH